MPAFIVSELFRENQKGVKQPPPPRLGLNCTFSKSMIRN